MQQQLAQLTSMVQEQQSLLRNVISMQQTYRGEQLEISNRLVMLEAKTQSFEGITVSHSGGKKNRISRSLTVSLLIMINSHFVYAQQDYVFGCVGAHVIKKTLYFVSNWMNILWDCFEVCLLCLCKPYTTVPLRLIVLVCSQFVKGGDLTL